MLKFNNVFFSTLKPIQSRWTLPWCNELKHLDMENGIMIFNGYFYPKEESPLPFTAKCSIDWKGTKSSHTIELLHFKELEDTSQYFEWEEDDGEKMDICLTPTKAIELHFRVVSLSPDSESSSSC